MTSKAAFRRLAIKVKNAILFLIGFAFGIITVASFTAALALVVTAAISVSIWGWMKSLEGESL